MKTQAAKAITAIVVLFALFSMLPLSFAQNYTSSFKLMDKQGENAGYTLNVVVPETLLQYYQEKSHRISVPADFTTFVTPYALQPIADCLRQIYPADEDFVNGALMIVHQMTYVETKMGKYPAETLVDNQGDCDVFSYVAASIIKAGGLDVVLLDYEEQAHMNIGVHLSSQPKNAREQVYKITNNGTEYYIAETTGGNWTRGWRVGECPDIVKQAEAQVLTLENVEEIAPGQVSASFKQLEGSEISLEIWPPIAMEQSTVTFKGAVTPTKPGENITIYLGISGFSCTILGTTQTKADGTFEYAWTTNTTGVYAVRASWAGDDTYAGTTSETISTTVLPTLLVALIAVAITAVILSVIAVVVSRHSTRNTLAPLEPEPPTFSPAAHSATHNKPCDCSP
jgi:Bacterial Ig-like domain (group 3)